MITYTSSLGDTVQVYFNVKRDKKRGIRIELVEGDGIPYAVASCAMGVKDGIPEGYVAIKDYAENEGMLKFLVDFGVVNEPEFYVASGSVRLPVCKFNETSVEVLNSEIAASSEISEGTLGNMTTF